MREFHIFFTAAAFVLLAATILPTSAQTIRRVTTTGDAGNDGSSWANAMTLQTALAASTMAGDQVWIAQGTYKPDATDRTVTFRIPTGVLVYGGFVGTDAATDDDGFDPVAGTDGRTRETDGAFTNETTLSGDLAADDGTRPTAGAAQSVIDAYIATRDDNSYTVVTLAGANVRLNGLTIEAGERGADPGYGTINIGAGLYAGTGTAGAVVQLCTFTKNNATLHGGGAYFRERTTLTGCTFNNNSTDGDGGGAAFFGTATVTQCTFTDNETIDDGGGAVFFGTATVTQCTFTDNETIDDGGGAYFSQAGSKLVNCVFANNSATHDGGGVYFSRGGLVINATFYNNTATQKGGGVYVDYFRRVPSTFMLQNSLLIDNTTTNDAAGHQVYVKNSNPNNTAHINYNLIEGGVNGVMFEDEHGQAVVEITRIREATGGTTLFMSTTVGDDNFLRLADNTVALNAGNNDYVNMTTPPITHDAAGNVRIQGVVGNELVDLGAYESTFETIVQAPQTIDFTLERNSVVGVVLDLTGITSSRLAITYTSSNTGVAEAGTGDQAGKLILKAVGTAMITASQAGTADFMAATAVTQTIRVREPIIRRVTMTGTGDGSNWTQAMTLQAALAVTTMPGDHIWMATGTYRPGMADDGDPSTDEREATFRIPEGVVIYGGFVGTDAATDDDGFDPVAGTDGRVRETDGTFTNETILSGDLANNDAAGTRDDNSYTVVTFVGKNVRLNGLTIGGGERGSNPGGGAAANYFVGAGLCAGAGTKGAVVQLCTFTNNHTTIDGGGAYFRERTTLTGCTFNNNTADDDGGGAFFRGTATLTGCTFNNNTVADEGGGAFFVEKATLLTDCAFNNNSANDNGGGAFFRGTATLTGCTFTDNTASSRFYGGGGAYFFRTARLTGCTFNNNTTHDDGGGAFFYQTVTLTGCTFTGNTAKDSGGGAFFFTRSTLIGCTFTNNMAEGAFSSGGGGFFVQTATLTGCTFAGNTAIGQFSNGGGAYFSKFGDARVKNCIFANNNAAKGGGLQLQAGGTVTNSTFYNNTADTQGGGIFFDDPVTLQNSLLLGNTAADAASGHQVYVANADANVVNIQHNLLAGGAAGIAYKMSGASGITEENTVTENDAAVVFASTDAATADFLHLRALSPAVGAGNNDYLNNGTPANPDDDIMTDAAGNARIQAGTVDLGAYESAFATPTAQTLMFTSDATGMVGGRITLAVTASSTLPVTFAITTQTPTSGTGNVATLAAGVLTLVSAGTVVITATQAGGDSGGITYAAATAMQTITVEAAVGMQPQTIDFTLADTGNVEETINLTATASSMLNVSFAISPATGVATLVDNSDGTGTLTLTGEGAVTVTASQGGNDAYAAATPVERTITVSPVVLGIEEDTDDFVLYPNPVSGELHFSERVAEFRLYGIEGRLLETRKNVRSVDLTARPAGLYFVEVVRNGRNIRYRIIRQ